MCSPLRSAVPILGLLLVVAATAWTQQQTGSDKPDRNLPDGLKALKDPDPRIRYSSLELVIKFGPSARFAAPTLHEMLNSDQSLAVKLKTAEALWVVEQTSPRTLLPVLQLGLQQKQADLRLQAVRVLGKIGPPIKMAIPELRETLKDPDLSVKMQAALALGEMGKSAKKAVPDLLALLPSDDLGLLQATVALALSKIGPETVPALVAAQKKNEVAIRRGAMYALSLLGEEAREAAPAGGKAVLDPDPVVTTFALKFLGQLGPHAKAQVAEVRAALQRTDPLVRAEAAVALWQVARDASGVPVLVALLREEDPEVRARAASGLGQLGQAKSAGPALALALQDKTAVVRRASVGALGKLGPAARPWKDAAGKLLQDSEPEVQVEAARALWRIDGVAEVVVPVLARALGDDLTEVRLLALTALAEMGPAAKGARQRVSALAAEGEDSQVRTVARETLARIQSQKLPPKQP